MTIPAGLAVVGLLMLVLGGLVLRTIGPGFRIGRLLSSTPAASIDDALAIAREGKQRYVRISGRISSDEEFPDYNNRPLVFRRTRLETRAPDGRWATLWDDREAVPFGIETRQSFIAVDEAELSNGLVVMPRVSAGRVQDLPSDLAAEIPAGTPPDAEARLTIEQLSAVEHVTVVGQPVEREGRHTMTAGLGRPLIVAALEQPAAMRVLAGGNRNRVLVGAAALAAGLGLLAFALVALVVGV